MKKGLGFVLISSILLFSMISFVSAQANLGEQIVEFVDQVVKVIEPIAKYLVGDSVATATYTAGTLLFAKVLFLLLVFSIIYLALTNIDFFNYQPWALWIICIAASILSTRFLGNDLVPAILIPYNALGLFLTAGIPLVLAFFVIERGMAGPAHALARKVAWIFFAVIFIGLWFARGSALAAAWVYPITAVIALIMMWMDGTIQSFFNDMALRKASAMGAGPALATIDGLIAGVRSGYATQLSAYTQHYPPNPAVTGMAAYKHDMKELEQQRKVILS